MRVTEADDTVAGSDDELAGLELADSSDAHVEALLDGRQCTSQLPHRDVDDDDVTGRRADVRVLVLVVDLATHTDRQTYRRECGGCGKRASNSTEPAYNRTVNSLLHISLIEMRSS